MIQVVMKKCKFAGNSKKDNDFFACKSEIGCPYMKDVSVTCMKGQIGTKIFLRE
jgi:hypothetical protein